MKKKTMDFVNLGIGASFLGVGMAATQSSALPAPYKDLLGVSVAGVGVKKILTW